MSICDGWAAGLYLAAVVARRWVDVSTRVSSARTASLPTIFRLVLDQLPSDDREFLLDVSAVDRLVGPLCDAMVGRSGSDATLRRLADVSLFITALPGKPAWFTSHPLFREMLRRSCSPVSRPRGDASRACERVVRGRRRPRGCDRARGGRGRPRPGCGAVRRRHGAGLWTTRRPAAAPGAPQSTIRWCWPGIRPLRSSAPPCSPFRGTRKRRSAGCARRSRPTRARRCRTAATLARRLRDCASPTLCMNGVDAHRGGMPSSASERSLREAPSHPVAGCLGFAHLLGGRDDPAEKLFAASIDSARETNIVASVAGRPLAHRGGARRAGRAGVRMRAARAPWSTKRGSASLGRARSSTPKPGGLPSPRGGG